ncbi:OTU protein [Coemansia spiralis]|uniref:OTU protein n=2 Tax=Coemansia TaxID=4863 RepID=A0A9W8KW95_9FUNG|nr:otu domain-containing protein 6b [Coemansia spiralis]KAJ1991990.1 OTU protein [Coemansia umbellata]KAJ2625361.1 OTU protein [Coemansia sp. RSA 1358]KAJ2676170.1 OTU protein [Coemansia spiralis]
MSDLKETTLSELEARHRKEKKELIAQISSLKRTVAKGDKRKKKEVTAEIEGLNKQLNERHDSELKQLNSTVEQPLESPLQQHQAQETDNTRTETPVSLLNHADVDANDLPLDQVTGGLYGVGAAAKRSSGKKNKAKTRLQRRAEELKRMQDEAEDEAQDMVDMAAVESEAMNKLATSAGLCVMDIRPDGHCLYSAFADQINTYHSQSTSYMEMRKRAAEYMRNHSDDFFPFMVHDNGDMFDSSDFDNYCNRIENTADWGGQQEITALSHALKLPVHIYQTDAPVLRIGEEIYDATDPIRLSYHRHAYGLGEHYNSLHKTA